MGPHPHQALKNAQGDVVFCRQDDLAATRERLQHWAGRKKSLDHGGCKGSVVSEEGRRGRDNAWAKRIKSILDHMLKKGGIHDVRRGREEWAWAKMLVPDQA